MQQDRYLVRHGYVPDEALWTTCACYAELAERATQVWGAELQPIFAYTLPSNVERGDCNVLIADEQDFAIWRFGRGNDEEPKPLSKQLHLFDKRRLQRVRNVETRGDMYSFATVDKTLMKEAQVRVSLRNSAAKDIILYGRDDVIGEGSGDWGRLVIKSREVWGVRRPVFRYRDEDALIGIYNAEDYRIWSSYRREHCPELFVFEGGAPLCEPTPVAMIVSPLAEVALGSNLVHHEVVILPRSSTKTTAEENADAVERLRMDQDAASRRAIETACSLVNEISSAAEAIVFSGACGPSFTTRCNEEKMRRHRSNNNPHADGAAQKHQDAIVEKILRSQRPIY
ncbi:Hypothetical protein, putative [Bodo saltans]|uniref:Uncharacterized protein n=1 Tax=Bodo saltans TaxID=75058 RepID=A0A0S4J5G7_BODSA|nr:Hypothetical protein, putative [Bodo saltans]|eukprot:CUG56078.1 Hypothetical protein, putative [Bodo saltans]